MKTASWTAALLTLAAAAACTDGGGGGEGAASAGAGAPGGGTSSGIGGTGGGGSGGGQGGTTPTGAPGGSGTGGVGFGGFNLGGMLVGGNIPGMIDVPAGSFTMGCNTTVDTQCDIDESPPHGVTLSAYSIDETEVTRAAYNACVVDGVCREPPCDFHPTGLPDHPVTCVIWADAHRYCAWAGKRLPTEAEWEYAARGDTGTKFPWGDSFGANCGLANINWCASDTHAVGSHPSGASPLGPQDMTGNVDEWVSDFYLNEYYAESPSQDPSGPASGAIRVLRGGGFDTAIRDGRASNRDAHLPTLFNDETGFRCAL